MDRIADVFNGIAARAESSTPKNAEDYINPADGLMYCGKCHTPKQCRVTLFGVETTPYCTCECEQERLKNEREEMLQRQREAEIQRFKADCGLPNRFRSESFMTAEPSPENERSFLICKKYAVRFDEMYRKNQGLLLYGGVGTGKTFSAACIANELLNKGVSVIFTSFVQLLGKSKGFDIDSDMVGRLCGAGLLIIDDFGAERNTDFALEKVYSIIDSRYAAGKPMVITTNLDLAEMQTCTDIRSERIYERIFEICYPVQFKGQSRRIDIASGRFREMEEFLK